MYKNIHYDSEVYHSHCDNCVALKCAEKCPIVDCDNRKCHFRMHFCKLMDHRHICPHEKVSCINHAFGCNHVMQRKDISKHLVQCPANVIHCNFEWNRRSINADATQWKTFNADDLDVALTLRDERILKQMTTKPMDSDAISNGDSWQMSTPGLQSSVCAELLSNDYRNDEFGSDENKLDFSSAVEPFPLFGPHRTAQFPYPLSLDIDVRTFHTLEECYRKSTVLYAFRCAKEFRRDEYEWHYKNSHDDVHGSIDGWMQHRCPLWQYGCGFVHRRLRPQPHRSKIVFNSLAECFAIVYPPHESEHYSNGVTNFALFPFEVLQCISHHLDAFSLKNLSLTCKRLRDVCRSFLDNRGIVSLVWERKVNENGKFSWNVKHKKWTFSCAFTPVKSWTLDDHHPVMEHLSKCPFNVREPKLEPFKLPLPKRREWDTLPNIDRCDRQVLCDESEDDETKKQI